MRPVPGKLANWLGKADEDLASAHVLIGAYHFSGALFFCRQAAEKSLKAFLTWHERTFRRTHDLEELGKDCLAIDATPALIDEADVLSDYAWKLRYPGAPYTPEREEGRSTRLSVRTSFEQPCDARVRKVFVLVHHE
jgi:HEPN domain-containing protein